MGSGSRKKGQSRTPEPAHRAARRANTPAKRPIGVTAWSWKKQAASLLTILVSVYGLVAGWSGLRDAYLARTEPRIDVRWYEVDQGKVQLCGEGVAADPPELSPEDLDLRRVRLPIQLAFANLEGRRLESVRAVLRFGSDVSVSSSGNEVLSGLSDGHIFEHDIGTLEPTRTFKPLLSTDTMYVAVDSLLVGAFRTMGAGIPEYIESLRPDPLTGGRSHGLRIKFQMDILVSGRRAKTVDFELPGQIVEDGWWPPRVPVRTSHVTAELRAAWDSTFAGSWDSTRVAEIRVPRTGDRIAIRAHAFSGTHALAFRMNGVPKRAEFDFDGDGMLDIVLVDSTSRGRPVTALAPVVPFALKVPWAPSRNVRRPFGLNGTARLKPAW